MVRKNEITKFANLEIPTTEEIRGVIISTRKSSGLSREDFAKKIGVSYAAIYRWENRSRNPNLLSLKKLTAAFKGV